MADFDPVSYMMGQKSSGSGGGGGGGDWQSVTLLTETDVTMSPGEKPFSFTIEHSADLGIGRNDIIAVEVTGDLLREVTLTGSVGNNDNLEIYASMQDGDYYVWADDSNYYLEIDNTGISTAPIVNIRIAKIVPVGYTEPDEPDDLQ